MVPWEMVGAPGSFGGLTLITSSPVNKKKSFVITSFNGKTVKLHLF